MRMNGKLSAAGMVFSLALLVMIGLSPTALATGDDLVAGMVGIRLTDPELDAIRGGYGGMYFSAYFSVFWDTLDNQVASGLVTTGGGSIDTFPTAQQIADLQGHGVSVTAAMGGLGNAKGAFHIVQVPGSYNIVNSNFIIQLTMIQVSQTALPKLKPLLPW